MSGFKRRTVVASALIWIVSLAGISFGKTKPQPNARSSWQNYFNPDFGFTLHYPPDLTLNAGGLAYKDMSLLSYIPVCDQATVACFIYNGRAYLGTNFEAAALSVNILRDARTDEACSKINTGSYPLRIKLSNGIRFHYGMQGGVGMGHAGGGLAYRAF